MVLIIGAGLSGLLIGFRLQAQNIPFKILEARSRVGGRIHTLYNKEQAPVEMGATWFGDHHRHLVGLLEELGIEYFKQQMDATVFYEPVHTSKAQIVEIPEQAASYRMAGGTSHLINTLYRKLDPTAILLNQPVREINFQNNQVEVVASDTFKGDQVVLALPPKLWAKNISFQPPLPNDLMQVAQKTHTWMEDSIKVAVTFDTPFWEEKQLPRTLFSNVGPITEFYDHADQEQKHYALCGFVNPALKTMSDDERREKVVRQLVAVFGEKATAFTTYQECVWGTEAHTAIALETPLVPHQHNGNPLFRTSFFEERLLISSSESAKEFPGYMDGAVSSAQDTVEKILKNLS